MLSVRYAPEVPRALAEMVEHYARQHGLSLAALEVIGSSLDFVERFLVEAEEGRAVPYLQTLGLAPPEDPVKRARWVADRIFR